jgi:hypothetical protein
VKIVQKIHVIILEASFGSATVCAVKTMKFQDVSPSSSGNGCTAPVRSAAESRRSMKAVSLPPNRTSQTNPLRQIAQRFALARQCLDERGSDELFDREFPFQIEACTFSNGHSGTLRDGQNRLALVMPLSGLLRLDIGKRPVELCAGEILLAPDLNTVVRVRSDETHVEVLVISFLPRFVYSLGSPSHDYFFLLPFYANYGLKAPVVGEDPPLHEIHRIVARLVQCYLAPHELLRGWLQGAFSRVALLHRPAVWRGGLPPVRTDFPKGPSGKNWRPFWSLCKPVIRKPSPSRRLLP